MKRELLKKVQRSVRDKFLAFGGKSSVHGLKYIVQDRINIFKRLFWVLVLIGSSFCVYLLLLPVVQRSSVVSYVPSTLYLEWNTVFPAVSVCHNYLNNKATVSKLMKLYPELMGRLDLTAQKHYADLLYGKGSCGRSLCGPEVEGPDYELPWNEVVEKIYLTCEEMVSDCKFNGQEFKCCQKFQRVDSENGPCYAFNSLHRKNNAHDLFTVNRTTGPGILTFNVKADSTKIVVHGAEELASNFLSAGPSTNIVGLYTKAEFIFSVVEMESDPAFRREGVDVRECRYPHELIDLPFHRYKAYSYAACMLGKDTEELYDQCGCVHPGRDIAYQEFYCNISGIHCMMSYKVEKIKLGIVSSEDDEDCLPSCIENELAAVLFRTEWSGDEEFLNRGVSEVTIRMSHLPTIRYRRTLLRTDLDLVVTVGGMAGLFFGASILSLVETLYLIFRRD